MLIQSSYEFLAVVVYNDNAQSHEEELNIIADLFLEHYYAEISSSQPAVSEKSAHEFTQAFMQHSDVEN